MKLDFNFCYLLIKHFKDQKSSWKMKLIKLEYDGKNSNWSDQKVIKERD